MKDRQYVVAYNTTSIVPLRHIVALNDNESEYDEAEFKAWYYGIFARIDGDEFEFCPDAEYMNEFVENLKKKRSEKDG